MEHGKRAFQAVKDMAKRNGTSFREECEKLGTTVQTVRYWKRNKSYIASIFLEQMHRNGYDIIYILTGETKWAKDMDTNLMSQK